MKKVYVEVKDGLPINVDVQNAIDGFEAMGYQIKPITKEDVICGKYDIGVSNGNIFVGSYGSVITQLKNIDKLPEVIDFPNELIGKHIKDVEVRRLKEVLDQFSKDEKPIFIKPKNSTKLFTGCVLRTTNQFSYFDQYGDIEVWTRPVIENLISEYRVFVMNGEIIYSSNYCGSYTVIPDFGYVNDIIKDYKNSPKAYTIDIGITNTGINHIIEINDFWAIGAYGLVCIDYASMLKARWNEILKMEN